MRELAASWIERLKIHATSGSANITSLSGGNQQKVVIARALAADASVIVLDDPTRGVDMGTKADLYRLFRSLADEGRAVLWYSTDDAEFAECDRTLVLRDGAVVAEFARGQTSEERLVEASFRKRDDGGGASQAQLAAARARRRDSLIWAMIPPVTFALVFTLCAAQNPLILSAFGLTLVFSAAFALSFAAISQLFVIAAGDIDLGLGNFIGLVNALAATWLVTDPWLALLCFAGMLAAYPLMGLFIDACRVPAIIVTLGLSFVWLGLAAYRLPRAGGSAPDWLVDLLRIKTPLIPLPVLLCIFPAIVAYLVLMVWRYGAVLRGFGASPRAIEAAGWSTRSAKATLYGFAGTFAFLAGMVDHRKHARRRSHRRDLDDALVGRRGHSRRGGFLRRHRRADRGAVRHADAGHGGHAAVAVRGQRGLPADGPGSDAARRDRHPDPVDLEDGAMTALADLRPQAWLWPAAASVLLMVMIGALSPEFRYSIVTANLTAASFLALVGIGQMFPVASGEGGIDLSIPFVMNFCAFLAVQLITADPWSIPLVLLLGIGFGVAVGLVNGIVVVRVRVPPIIGTLAVGFIVLTLVQLISASGDTTFADRTLTNLMRSQLLGMPTPFYALLAVAALAMIVIRRTVYGRTLLAVGQSRRAAHLAGIDVDRTVLVVFMISGGLAGLTGPLLAASVGSADLELGNPYLLASVGAVVLGGNQIAGGTATVVGTIFGAILLTLLVAAVTMAGLPIEFQNIARGAVITLVLVVANAPETWAAAMRRTRFAPGK